MAVGCRYDRCDRRAFLGLLGVGLAAAVSGCTAPVQTPPVRKPQLRSLQIPRVSGPEPAPPPAPAPPVSEPTSPPPSVQPPQLSEPPSPPPTAASGGQVVELRAGPSGMRQIALTIDDGYCTDCVAGYVTFAQRTGIHLTFSPNGSYAYAWAPHATVLRPLIEAGQVQIMNHTFSHPNLTRLPPARVVQELERNEQWITTTFTTTARPYYRPPFGAHNPDVDDLAADAGFDRVVMWNGSFSDSQVITPQFLMTQARKYLQPGAIMLGHANHPTVLALFDEITQLIGDRQLQPVTLDEMFGTLR